MADVWSREWNVGGFFSRWSYYGLTAISDGETLLRMYVSWHAVGDWWAMHEPLFVGVELRSGPPGEVTAPDDPAAGFFGLTGEWLAAETHAPVTDSGGPGNPQRIIWPRDGFRIWDIKANRKPVGELISPFIVWALPQDSAGKVGIRVTQSTLKRVP